MIQTFAALLAFIALLASSPVARAQQHVQQGQIAIWARMLATVVLSCIHVPNHQCQNAQRSQMVPDLQYQYFQGCTTRT